MVSYHTIYRYYPLTTHPSIHPHYHHVGDPLHLYMRTEWDEAGTYPHELHKKAYDAGILAAMVCGFDIIILHIIVATHCKSC
jgi:hypothetical protein